MKIRVLLFVSIIALVTCTATSAKKAWYKRGILGYLFSEKDNTFNRYNIQSTTYPTLKEWKKACADLPYFNGSSFTYQKAKNFTFKEFEDRINDFASLLKSNDFLNKNSWVNQAPVSKENLNLTRHDIPFEVYAQKLELPAGSKVAFHGDLHGDVHSLLKSIDDWTKKGYMKKDSFKIIDPNFYIVFLGDYVDRGNYGSEVLYTVLRLKLANPNNVFMVRGNHEDRSINTMFGFSAELLHKFPRQRNFDVIYNFYHLLPVVLYIGNGSDFFQCNHGGMEIGYLPHNLLDNTEEFEKIANINRSNNFAKLNFGSQDNNQMYTSAFSELCERNKLHKKLSEAFDVGFMWNDFFVKQEKSVTTNRALFRINTVDYKPGRGFIFGNIITTKMLEVSSTKTSNVVGVFRAHQHSGNSDDPMMKSILTDGPNKGVSKLWQTNSGKLWNGMVATFNVSPDTPYGKNCKFTFDTYGILTIGNIFPNNWKLDVHRIEVVPKS